MWLKNERTKKYPPPLLVLLFDRESGMDKNQYPGYTSRIRNIGNFLCFSFNYFHSVGGPAVVFGPRGHPGDSPGLPGQASQVLLPHPRPLRPGHPARRHRTAALRHRSRHSARGMLEFFLVLGIRIRRSAVSAFFSSVGHPDPQICMFLGLPD